MDSKIIFLLLSAFVLIDLSTANKEYVALLCRLADKNALWLPVGNRQCTTGCLGDPEKNPLILFNNCEPIKKPSVKQLYYAGISFFFLNNIQFFIIGMK